MKNKTTINANEDENENKNKIEILIVILTLIFNYVDSCFFFIYLFILTNKSIFN